MRKNEYLTSKSKFDYPIWYNYVIDNYDIYYDWDDQVVDVPPEVYARALKALYKESEGRNQPFNELMALKALRYRENESIGERRNRLFNKNNETRVDISDFWEYTPEGKDFWSEVLGAGASETLQRRFFRLYPQTTDKMSDKEKYIAAILAVNQFLKTNQDESGYRLALGELRSLDISEIDILYSMVYNQIKQGNPADVFVFAKNKVASKKSGGFDFNETDEGSDFWDNILVNENYSDYFTPDNYPQGEAVTIKELKADFPNIGFIGQKFKDSSLSELVEPYSLFYADSNREETEGQETERELQEGENRVNFFIETKNKQIQNFKKEFPDAEEPFLLLLGLLSEKEEERIKKLPEDVKKKAAKEKKKFKKQIQDKKQLKDKGVQVIDFKKDSWRGMTKFQAPKSSEGVEGVMSFDNISTVEYDYFVYNPEIREYVSIKPLNQGFNLWTVENKEDYNEFLEYLFLQSQGGAGYGQVKDKFDEIKVKVTYDNGETLTITYDADKFKPIPNKEKPKKEDKKEKFKVVLAKDEGLDESMGKYYVLREDGKFIAVKTKLLANYVMEEPDGFFKLYFDEGFAVDEITAMQYIEYKEKRSTKLKQERRKKREQDKDLEELKKEIDDADACDLSLDALACELDELDDI